MYCNINEAFGGNSTYIKNYLDNELNNQKLLEKYNNFDNFFSKEEKEAHQQYSNNIDIVEHFDSKTTPKTSTKTTIKPIKSTQTCNKNIDHVLECAECRKQILVIYIKNLFKNTSLDNPEFKNIISIGLIFILFIVVIKILWKL
jgi:hypothetical protein